MSATVMAAPRQPFGAVSNARLRNLTNMKNKQNGMWFDLTYTSYYHHASMTMFQPIIPSLILRSSTSIL